MRTFLCIALIPFISFAQESLGGWGVTLGESIYKIKLGGRFQAVAAKEEETSDMFIRRARLNLEYRPWVNHKFYMDIRNDNVDRGNERGSGEFELGDAYYQYESQNDFLKNIRLMRAKVDVSRSQTASSKDLFQPYRALISDHAANFVSSNRRATNIQANGSLVPWLSFHLVLGDGITVDDFEDLNGSAPDEIISQDFMYGGKLKFSPADWKEDRPQETYYGKGKHFTLGTGYFALNNIHYLTNSTEHEIDRRLFNGEISFHNGPFNILGEYFKFEGEVDLTDPSPFTSEGYYTQAEWVFTDFHFIAPFFRYEYWNRNLAQYSSSIGLNYYLAASNFRYGLVYTDTKNERSSRIYMMANF